jgi:hypothetical protein
MTQIVQYNVTDAAIEKMKSEYMALTVTGLDDEIGFKQVHEARMIVKSHRVEVEKTRKGLKADALEWGKKVEAEAKRVTALLEPIETHLQTEEEKITKEKERIRQEKIRIEEKRVAGIKEKINIIKTVSDISPSRSSEEIKKVNDYLSSLFISKDEFAEFEDEAKSILSFVIFKISTMLSERLEYEKQQAEAKAEAERLEKLRKEQEEAQAKIDAENTRIAEENRKIQEEKDRIEREKKAEQERKDREEFERKAKEDARIQAEKEAKEVAEKAETERKEREAREAKEAEEKAKREAEEAARREALKPIKQKLFEYADIVKASLSQYPSTDDAVINSLIADFIGAVEAAFNDFCDKVEAL